MYAVSAAVGAPRRMAVVGAVCLFGGDAAHEHKRPDACSRCGHVKTEPDERAVGDGHVAPIREHGRCSVALVVIGEFERKDESERKKVGRWQERARPAVELRRHRPPVGLVPPLLCRVAGGRRGHQLVQSAGSFQGYCGKVGPDVAPQ